mmetsp:Transcript_5506/g.13198  ORF Transcript_5506/g.13198 Transcript_5506/m.13198 type:complete len:257 (+) Transcript_5506:1162-1932(+)
MRIALCIDGLAAGARFVCAQSAGTDANRMSSGLASARGSARPAWRTAAIWWGAVARFRRSKAGDSSACLGVVGHRRGRSRRLNRMSPRCCGQVDPNAVYARQGAQRSQGRGLPALSGVEAWVSLAGSDHDSSVTPMRPSHTLQRVDSRQREQPLAACGHILSRSHALRLHHPCAIRAVSVIGQLVVSVDFHIPSQAIPPNLQFVAHCWGLGAVGDMVCYISNTPRSAHDSHLDRPGADLPAACRPPGRAVAGRQPP